MSSQTETARIRQATVDDLPFIRQMCYEAAFPEEFGDRPTFEEAQNLEWFQEYTDGWPGRKDDFGIIAEDENGKPVGAAWYRDYPHRGLGPDIPTHELSIALIPEERGKKLGRQLLKGLMEGASERGIDKLVLQVKHENKRARALYEKAGFLAATQPRDGYEIMVGPTTTKAE